MAEPARNFFAVVLQKTITVDQSKIRNDFRETSTHPGALIPHFTQVAREDDLGRQRWIRSEPTTPGSMADETRWHWLRQPSVEGISATPDNSDRADEKNL